MEGLKHLLKMILFTGNGFCESVSLPEVSVKGLINRAFGIHIGEYLVKMGKVGFKANYLVILNRYIQGFDVLVHITNVKIIGINFNKYL